MKRIPLYILYWLLACGLAMAAQQDVGQKEVHAFIEKLYSIDSRVFEMGRFNGKYNPKLQAELHINFFSNELLGSAKGLADLEGFGLMRHPSASTDDLSGISGFNLTKHPKISSPVITGDYAYVNVYPDGGRTFYYLVKTKDGWRIINAAYYDVWPNNYLGICRDPVYLTKPTSAQLKFESKECR